MPELPEVQSVVNYYRPLLTKLKLSGITSPNNYKKVFDTHSVFDLNKIIKGQSIIDIHRRGKYIIFDLTGNNPPKLVDVERKQKRNMLYHFFHQQHYQHI